MFNKETSVFKVIDAETIIASGSHTSPAINVGKADGFFSVEYTTTGTGTTTIEYLVSSSKTGTFVTPSTASAIATAAAAGSDLISFSPVVAKYMKIKATEAGGANPVVITARLIFQ